ncbi:hypothetical protein KFU94_64235 [Chloroflexi bacterium TSY]|nr:hypothetical protein [Chloroflexi bacterium TSY]
MKVEGDFLQRLKERDQVAWMQLVECWEQPLYNYIRGNNILSPQDVEDILLETWGAAPRAIDNFDGQNATLKTFLFSLARRKVADYWRKHKPVEELSETIAMKGSSLTSGLELREALANLREQERQVLVSVDPNLAFLAIFSRDCRDFGVIYSDFGYRKQPISYLKIAQI